MSQKELNTRFKIVRIREDVLKELRKLQRENESVCSVIARLMGIDYNEGLQKKKKT